jgi:class 3 adenylate cyclase
LCYQKELYVSETPLRRTSDAHLSRILGEMLDQPEAKEELTREIYERYGETRAILVLDMSGFTRTTQLRGVVAFLLMFYRMRQIVAPIIQANGGVVVKTEADNLYCLLDTVESAITAARSLISRLEDENASKDEDQRIYVSIGIGYGCILNIAQEDIFGDEVNLASKLGEDLAERGQVLLTNAASAHMPPGIVELHEVNASISGIPLTYHRLS